ncbi:SHOCT domain-containing protein [Actinoplanes sp. NPDC049599]|uniref:SHOCT domain-containing protein n=1 Tax=Actinoplanes sp. NPDC049599 TaxID=3363903 RepID=UPI0037A0809E
MMYYGTGMNGWGWVLMSLSGLLFWGLVVAAVIAAVRYTSGAGRRAEPVVPGLTPQQVLADRFARGDIDEEEYTRRLRVLNEAPPASGPGRGSSGT